MPHNVVFYFTEGQEAHFQPGHPERPERMEAIRQALQAAGWWDKYPQLEAIDPPMSVIRSIHTPAYLERLKAACALGEQIDYDTYTTPASWDLALKAAGGSMAAGQAVWSGEALRAYTLPRPPGHHATPNRAMGFCLLNNIAMTAEYLIQIAGAQRLAIIDLDLHHGNGTQEIFWSRKDVFFISVHQWPLFPGSGDLKETGAGSGKGMTANFPLPPASGDHAYRVVMRDLILPLLETYQPQMLLVSLGFDAHWLDPLGHLRLSAGGYGELIAALVKWSNQHCDGKILLLQEGGYNLQAAAACSQAAVAALLDTPWEDPLGPSPRGEGRSWLTFVQIAKEFWGLN